MELQDSTARETALNIKKSFIVQAPAGSGKTGLLTQRFLALLGTVNQPEECLAITFTRKAQTEMQTRIINELIAAEMQQIPQDPFKKRSYELAKQALAQSERCNWQILDNPQRLKIKTIDALCAGIISRTPVMARFGGEMAIASDPNMAFNLAIERVLGDPKLADPYRQALNILLAHLDNNLQLIKKLFLSMLPMREQWLPYIMHTRDEQSRQLLNTGLQNLAKEILTNLVNTIPRELDYLPEVARQAGEYLLASKSNNSIIKILAEYNTWPGDDLVDLPAWLAWGELLLTKEHDWRQRFTVAQGFPAVSSIKNKIEKAVYQAHKNLILTALESLIKQDKLHENLVMLRHLPPVLDEAYTEQQWQVLNALTIILPYLVAQLILVFKETGKTDFNELNIAATAALGRLDAPSELALMLDYKLKHILVDEFQDTSIVQFKLLEQLTQGWIQGDGRTLFLVGDPMQSIYRFRQAEVSLFLQAKNTGIGDLKLTYLQLSTNFRSDSALITWFNQLFTKIFPSIDNFATGAVSYKAATTSKDIENNDPVKFYLSNNRSDPEEAKKIIEIIKNIRQSNPQDSIAILVRAKNHLQGIISQLKQENIPYQGIEIDKIINNLIVRDLLTLTNALLHLGDRIAWLALLRAPWCGLTLQDLHCLCAENKQDTLWQIIQEYDKYPDLSTDGRIRLKHIINILQSAMIEKNIKTWSLLIKQTWELLGGDNLYLTEDNSINNQQSVADFFAVLQEHENDRELYKPGFLTEKIQNLFVSVNNIEPTAVQLMTIHKAKGLEFDHVILPGLGRTTKKYDETLLRWDQRIDLNKQPYLLLAPIKAVGEATDLIYNCLKFMDQQKSQNELIRLFYVAATRAKKTLYGLGHLEQTVPKKGSLLALLWQKIDVQELNFAADINRITSELDNSKKTITRVTTFSIKNQSFIENNINNTNHKKSIEYLRQAGILVHEILAQMGKYGLELWQQIALEDRIIQWQQGLQNTGLFGEPLEAAVKLVKQAVNNILMDPIAKWLLNYQHLDSKVEWELIRQINGSCRKFIIDRYFIDQSTKINWIVDYKICHQEEIQQILPQYITQLKNYQDLILQLNASKVIKLKLGLYFPLQKYFWQTN